jgi:inosose dehydratase
MSAKRAEFIRYVGAAVFAGFDGVEFGARRGLIFDARSVAAVLEGSGAVLSAVTVRGGWRDSDESESERALADHWITFASSFHSARVVLEQVAGSDRSASRERQSNAISCLAAVGRRAEAAGVRVTFCPDSAEGSLFRNMHDLERLFTGLGDAPVGYTPHLRHIAQNGMDALDVIHTFRDRVDHVRLGAAADVGSDVIDAEATERARVVAYLAHTGFTGWFVMDCWDTDPLANREGEIQSAGHYVKERLAPLIMEAQRARAEEAAAGPAPESPHRPNRE